MLLEVTAAGAAQKANARENGLSLPKFSKLFVDDTESQADLSNPVFSDGSIWYENDGEVNKLIVERVGNSAFKIYGSVPPDVSGHVRGIGLMTEDGIKYAYGRYVPDQGGVLKPDGMNLQFEMLLSEDGRATVEFIYSPMSSDNLPTMIGLVSQEKDGLMMKADKIKLDSLSNDGLSTSDAGSGVTSDNSNVLTLSAFATMPTVNANDMSVVDDGEEFLVFVARGASPLQMTPVSYDGVIGSTVDLPFTGYYTVAFKQGGSVFFAIAVGDSVKLYEYVKPSNVATQVDTLSGYKLYGLHVFIDTQDRVFFGVMGANSSNQGAVTSGNARVFFRATKDDLFSKKYTSSNARSTTVGLSEVDGVIWINASGKLHVFDEASESFTTRSALTTAWSSYYNSASFVVKHPTDANKMLVVAWAGYGTYVNYVYEVDIVSDTSVNTATLDGAIGSPVGIQATDSGFSLLLSNGEVYDYDVTSNDFVSPASLSIAIPATALPRAHAQNQMVADSGKLVYSVPVSGTGNSELYATG